MPHFAAGAVIVLTIITASCASSDSPGTYGKSRSIATDSMYTSRPAPMEPSRTVAEQDCTKPIDLDRGNLLCK